MTSTPPQGDALRRLAQSLEDVTTRLSQVSAELRALAEPAPGRGMPPAAARPVVPPQPASPPHYGPMPGYGSLPPAPRPPKPSLSERLAADGAGSRLLAWIGGGITLIGVVLLLVLAIQRGWIGPVPRVLIGAVLACTLIAVSARVHRTPSARTGAFALAATGIAALYLDAVAATSLLGLVPPGPGLLIGLVIAGAGLTLAARWEAQPLALFVLVACAVCAPLITLRFDALLVAFLLVLQLATTPLQLTQHWRAVPLTAGIPPLLATMISAPYSVLGTETALRGAVLSLFASLLSIGVAAVTAHRRPGDAAVVVLLIGAPAPTLLVALLTPELTGAAITGLLAVPLITLWGLVQWGWSGVPARFGAAAGGLAALAVFEATALLLPGEALPVVLLGEALVLALAALRLRGRGLLLTGTGFAAAGTLLAMATTAAPELVLRSPRGDLASRELLLACLTFALIAGAALALGTAAARLGTGEAGAAAGWIAAGVAMLYGTSGVALSLALIPLPERTGFLLGHAVITVGWTVAALVLLLRGTARRLWRLSGLVLVGAALAKLVLFDLASLDGIARVAAFLGAGLVLLAAGTHYARLVAAQRTATTDAAAERPYDTEPAQPGANT